MEKSKDIIKNAAAFRVNPSEIYIDWDSNPRDDYGEDDFEELKKSIKEEGVRVPITIYQEDNDGDYCLAHGFRRMKAVLELLAEGVEIKDVLALKGSSNPEQILFDHLTLNSGKELNPVEKAETLLKLKKYGYTPKELTQKIGAEYQTIIQYLYFAENATKELKNRITSKEIAFTTAVELVRNSGNYEEQTQELKIAETKAKSEGRKKIRNRDLSPRIKKHNIAKRFNDVLKVINEEEEKNEFFKTLVKFKEDLNSQMTEEEIAFKYFI